MRPRLPGRKRAQLRFAEVAVDSPVGAGRTFTYSVPDGLKLAPGQLLRVPFGPRTLQGVLFELSGESHAPYTRDVLELVYPDVLLDADRLALARWVSDHYLCGLFEALAPMLPHGSRARPATYLESLLDDLSEVRSGLTRRQAEILEHIHSKGRVSQEQLIEARRTSRSVIDRLVDAGHVRRTEGGRIGPSVKRRMVQSLRLTGPAPSPDSAEFHTFAKAAPRQSELVKRLASEPHPMRIAEARREYGGSAVSGLLDKGWLETQSTQEYRDPLAGRTFQAARPVALTSDQAEAASRVRAALENLQAGPRSFLLHGVTGSGKTEVYLDAVARCIELGKRAIVLVPEIALTHQTVSRFAARFPGQVAVLHSGLSDGQRFDQWWKIKGGEYQVAIGSRSAIFAPLPDLGLIVLDEEHEWTYKQSEPSPRYHARDAALRLASSTGAVVLMGSATPELATYYSARRREVGLLELPARVAARTSSADDPPGPGRLPSVAVVDMAQELMSGNAGILSPVLAEAIGETLDAGEQVVLFLNRRGSGSFLQCRSCGEVVKCSGCDVALTYHRGAERLVCHYCGRRRRRPEQCRSCMNRRLSLYGFGTESVAADVEEAFPGATVVRWDRDTAGRLADSESILDEFASGRAQVLVGTQMVAKGLHFPSVSLVGVVLADIGLNVPDFRSGERTFQLLCQVAGRAGRGDAEGKVIIQTYRPDHYAVRAAAEQDFLKFYVQEMAFRKEHGNPPYAKVIRLVYAHTNRAHTERAAVDLSEQLRLSRDARAFNDEAVLGPAPAYPPRVRGRYRWQIVLRGPEPRRLLDTVAVPHGWIVDVDPVSFS